jgi:uncharacterized MAPEG superfamily protein
MHPEIRLLTYSAILAWIMIIAATALRTRGNLARSFGNRADLPEPTPMAARAERAARNMLENLVLFTAVVLAAQAANHGGDSKVVLGARLFFWARLAYFPVYLAGITHVRTALWLVSVTGMGIIVAGVL